ncbi:hypothetical protein GCM10022244_15160 [Streptomyces gulbargensis]|uniref:Uncharacterized protein n=1 Tax=Streptomyces gulbargensis TaxID=364901 RepID=A0ABP7LTR8_9ACTN
MRFLLWLLLAASVLANVYVSTFSGWGDGGRIAGQLATGAVLLGSATGLWATRARRDA